MPAGWCPNLKSGMATSAGEHVKAAKSACSLMAARGRELIGNPQVRSRGLLVSCLLSLTVKVVT